MLEEYPEPPDGETSAEKARRLWMPRAFLQTTFTSRMAQEACNDSTETAWTYHEHRRLLDDEMMAVCRIYAEVEWADLSAHEGERAQKWLMITHKNIEHAREHVAMRIREAGEWGAPPSLPEGRYSYRQEDRRRTVRATLQAEAAATRVRLQAVEANGVSGRPQPVTKVSTEIEEIRGSRPRGPAYPCAPSGTKAGLAKLDSETDTSDPGGMSQLFREPRALSAGLPEALRGLMGRWAATRGTAPRPGEAAEPQAKAEGPTPLGDRECKVCKGGTSDTSIVSQAVAQGAEVEGDEGVGSEAAVQGAGESLESDDDEGNSGLRPVLGARADSSPVRMGDRDEGTPTPGQSPGEGSEFARELASTMSAIASLVVKATGRSVSNGGWLYFSGEREDYRPFRARCRLFQETYHGMTPPKLLVSMFREWNLTEEAARHIKGAKDMRAAWRMLDAVYDGAPVEGLGAARAPEIQWVGRAEGVEAGAAEEKRLVPMKVGEEVEVGWQEKHVFINTPHGIRSLRRLWVPGEEPEHTVVSREAAQSCIVRVNGRRPATGITGPTGVAVGPDTECEMFLLADDLPGRTKRITVHMVDSLEEYCGLPPRGGGRVRNPAGERPREALEATA
jgi:hypothetical protein